MKKLTFADIRVGDREFRDISSEQWREYVMANGMVICIEAPIALRTDYHGHRVIDAMGVSHYIIAGPHGWMSLRFVVKPGCNHFDF
jgi:hypothetical protein